MARHSKKPSTATIQRRRAQAVLNMGSLETLSALALIGLRPPRWVLAPMWDQPPLDQIERPLASLVVLPDHQQFLARRCIVPRGNVPHPAVGERSPASAS